MKIVSIKKSNANDIKSFDCGIVKLNNYFSNYALYNDRNNIGKTFVLYSQKELIGFYTLSSASFSYNDLSEEYKKKLPKYPIPCIRIARLAIDIRYQNKGYGHFLIKDIFKRIYTISKHTGISFILVDSKESSLSFYSKFGFTVLPHSKLTMVLPITTLSFLLK